MKRKSKNQKAFDRATKHMDSMGILSLMSYMKDCVLADFDKKRMAVLQFQLVGYDDTPLSNVDNLRNKFEEVYDREFKKLYNQKEKEYNERTKV